MAKFIIEKFDPVIYPRKVWVAKGGDKHDLERVFNDIEGDSYQVSNMIVNSSYAITDDVSEKKSGDYGVIVWLHKIDDITEGIAAHEADHAANRIFKAIGATVDCDNDETHSYLVGFITDCIWKVIKRKA
jgi:hypothetical protein